MGDDGCTLALRPGMPCSWLVPLAAFAQFAWLAGASIKTAEASKAAGWHAGTSTLVRWRASQLQPTADWRTLSQAACIHFKKPLSQIQFCCLSVSRQQLVNHRDVICPKKKQKKKEQLNKWLIVSQLYNCDSYIQFIFILQMILVFSSYRSWIQLYSLSLLRLASCQENKYFLMSATLWLPKTNNCAIIVVYCCHILEIFKGDNLLFLSYENSDFYLSLTSAAQNAKWHNLWGVKCFPTAHGCWM